MVLPYIDMNMPLVYKGGKKDTFNVPCVVLDSKCIVLHKNYNTWEFQYYSNTKNILLQLQENITETIGDMITERTSVRKNFS